MAQTLILLRHAKAVPWGYEDDFNRELAPRGIKHMRRLARWLPANLEVPQRVLCSSSQRTRETLAPLLEGWPLDQEKVTYTDEIYLAGTGSLHNLAQDAFESVDSLMMVGHNPGFEYLAFHYMDRRQTPDIYKMATGTLGVFEFPEGYALDTERVHMRHWLRRKDLSGK
jgi:phosphohistidine phosphatase